MLAFTILVAGPAACSSSDGAPRSEAPGGDGQAALGIDTNPEGNSAAYLAQVDSCRAVNVNDVFEVDVYVGDVTELLAFDIDLDYDPAFIEIADRDVRLFLAQNPGSNVFDISDKLPDDDGRYGIAAADISDPPTPDSGTGPLARISLRATAAGTTSIAFSRLDVDDNGTVDIAPFLRNAAGDPIGDTDGDSLFDGDAQGGEIVVGGECNS